MNAFVLVMVILVGQFVLTTLADFAFAQVQFPGKDIVFVLVLMRLFILPEVLIVENYSMVSRLWLFDTTLGVGMSYMAQCFWHFSHATGLQRSTLRTARGGAHRRLRLGWYFIAGLRALAKPTYLAPALISASVHGNNFLWSLIVTNSPDIRPLTGGLSIFGVPKNGVNISVIFAATLMSVAPLLIAFLLFQRQFVQAFLRAGIKQ